MKNIWSYIYKNENKPFKYNYYDIIYITRFHRSSWIPGYVTCKILKCGHDKRIGLNFNILPLGVHSYATMWYDYFFQILLIPFFKRNTEMGWTYLKSQNQIVQPEYFVKNWLFQIGQAIMEGSLPLTGLNVRCTKGIIINTSY